MTRRCKPGQRARIIGRGSNVGEIVVVVRHYFGEKVGHGTWPEPIYPWVVTSLGRPLDNCELYTRKRLPPVMTIVVDDCDLEPLRDDDDGVNEAEGLDLKMPRPARRPVVGSA